VTTIEYLYESLKGKSRVINGELTIPGYTDEDYEGLYFALLEALAPLTNNFGGDFRYWYAVKCRQYHTFKVSNRRTYHFYDPHVEIDPDYHTIRQRLAVLKFYIGRRRWSRYGRKE
jgi:hypothetical protein